MAPSSRFPLNVPVSIDYFDSKGVLTHRIIYPIERYMRRGSGYVRAFCTLRDEERTFRADRIRSWKREKDDGAGCRWRPQESYRAAAQKNSSPAPEARNESRTRASESISVPVSERKKPSLSAALWILLIGLALFAAVDSGTHRPPAPVPKPIITPAPAPAVIQPKPTPKADEEKSPEAVSPAPACDECAERFRQATRIINPALESIYAAADCDRDGQLSWREVRIFQNWMKTRFVYRSNERALAPDVFLEEGGGDCEDWALFTCGMLRYWGWDAYLGTAGPQHRRRNSIGHAFTFIKTDEVPGGFEWFELYSGGWGFNVPTGKYVPVDYEVVGGYSSAVRRRWVIDGISAPESNYGEIM